MQISPPDSESTSQANRPTRAGDHVRVRGVRWRIVDVEPHDACRVVTLAALDDAHAGAHRRILEPFDRLESAGHAPRPRVVGARRWRHACRALIAADHPALSLTAARAARVVLMPHQLEPALAILGGAAIRVLLADEVGLGKTIEAALIVSELRARGWVERVLVLTPAGLRDQWREELHDKFGVDAVHVDAAMLRRTAAGLPIGVNPWTTVPTAIASVDYVKRAEVLPAVCACRWDIVVVDEAHGVVGDSDRHQAVRTLARRATYVLLLTATPHNGDDAAYETLRHLGSIDNDPLLVFRRTRVAVRHQPERRVRTLRVRLSRLERRVHSALARYGDAVDAEAEGAALAMTVLHKRAYSSAWALLQSVNRRLAVLAALPDVGAEQLTLPLGDGSGELSTGDEAPDWPDELTLADPNRERHLLTTVAEACAAAAAGEGKVAALARLLRRVNEPAIVFTEYRDTLRYLARRLPGVRIVLLHGGMNRLERAEALRSFSQGDRRTVLLTTDAAGEGLNLHHTCRLVVNLELPWNPMRLEQRIGRVDRIGQTRRVHVVHLVARGTGESNILARLELRVSRAHRAVGAPNPLGRDDGERDGRTGSATPFTNLAVAEAERLRVARAFTSPGAESIESSIAIDSPWIAVATDLRHVRTAIGNNAALIYRTSLETAYGRCLASRLVAVLIGGTRRVRTHRDMKGVANDLAQAIAGRVDSDSAAWKDSARGTVTAFLDARLARERSIAADLEHTCGGSLQPGLFDRRAERTHELEQTVLADARREAAERIAVLEQSTPAATVRHRLLLAVLP